MMFGNDAIVEPASREYWENKLKRDKEEMLKKTNDSQKKGGSDMTKNLIPIIAKELGVEIGEEFKISTKPEVIYRFTETHLERAPVNFEFQWGPSVLPISRLGDVEIIKIPFKPKIGDKYWTFTSNWLVISRYWENDFMDYIREATNCVFRTKEDAECAKPRIYKELTGDT